MCGIAGYVGEGIEASTLDAMCKLIRHRGPNDQGAYTNKHVGMGMRRLSIIDIEGGQQPIFNEARDIAVIFNGEIYNFEEIRADLQSCGYTFSTSSDTEVLVHGYEEWGGPELLKRLNGMFAFAIHDQRKGRVFIARDRLGIKPLYYTVIENRFYFASEVKAFKAIPEIPFLLNEDVLPEYLQLRYVPAPETLFKNIMKLPAGSHMTINGTGPPSIERYWKPHRGQALEESEVRAGYSDLLNDAVKIRLMSEVPLGTYLSEGIDSTVISWSASRQSNTAVTTYSYGASGEFDESLGAAETARKLSLENKKVTFDAIDFEDLARIIWHLDEPIGDAHILPTYSLAKAAKKNLTVVLLGEGADESLYGYPFYKIAFWGRRLLGWMPNFITQKLLPAVIERTPLRILNLVFPLPTSLGSQGRKHLANSINVLARGTGKEVFRHMTGLFSNEEVINLLPRYRSKPRPEMPAYFSRSLPVNGAEKLLLDINDEQFSGWLQDNILLRHDKLSMAHSIECRVPFLDHRFVEFMANAPLSSKISGWRDKCIARNYVRDAIDLDIAERPKRPFYMPLEEFVRGEIYKNLVAENLCPERIKRRGIFDTKTIDKLVEQATFDNFLAVKRVMSLVILELWQRIFIDDEFGFLQEALTREEGNCGGK